MASEAGITGDIILFDLFLNDPEKFRRLYRELAHDILADLISLAGQGKGVDGTTIKGSYSASYIKAIQEGRVKVKGIKKQRTSPVDLTISGELLQSRQIEEIDGGVKIFFPNTSHSAGETKSGKGSSISMIDLAKSLHSRGFTNWHKLGKDHKKTIRDETLKIARKMLRDSIKKIPINN